MLFVVIVASLFLSLMMFFAWGLQRLTGHSGWVDTIWSFSVGFAGLLVSLYPLAGSLPERQALVAFFMALWSLRLGFHIASRTLQSHDDPRYARLMEEWGDNSSFRLFLFLQSQAVAGIFLIFSVFLAAHSPISDIRISDFIGGAILFSAITGEAIADFQLRRFRANIVNKGQICDYGLWQWSRHPNYFFEWVFWLAFPVIALSTDYPIGLLSFIAPLLMYWLLVHVSGVPPLEDHMLRSRGQAFRDYQARTSAFFPLPPRQNNNGV